MDQGTQQQIISEVNPLFGQVGHLFVIVAFVSAIFSAVFYYLSARSVSESDKLNKRKTARIFFISHASSVVGIVTTMFIMIFNHHFEYQYVWSHSSLDLQKKYILSCFWEGQEGSFLLWSFWHVVLGTVILITAKKWEAPVMSIVSAMQVFLLSFLLGIYIYGNTKIGVSPFLLMQDALTQDPVFLFENYMQFIQDGTGLNALLQNYWMVIHPPVLFLGFASITIPFAYAMAGLMQKQYTEWIRPAIPFALFAGMVLGTGVLMGGAWAYEALSFGGFWAWDPVENASLIPWLLMVAALHNLLITKSTGHSMRSTYILTTLSFLFVLYASFLTRSGILGDTSVHAFVTEGLTTHLVIMLFFFILLASWLLIINWKKLPVKDKEEPSSSRDFWMFVGSLVLLFGGIHIVFFTSIPVFNVMFNTNFTPPVDPIHFYTGVQIWVGVLIAFITAFAQFLKYNKTDMRSFYRQIAGAFIIALIAAIISSILLDKIWSITANRGIFHLVTSYSILLFAAWFAVIANLQYFLQVLKGKIKVAGGSIAHIGFGILLLGILISNAGQKVISQNTSGIDYGKEFDAKFKKENMMLYQNNPLVMGDYLVDFEGDSLDNRERIFKLKFTEIDAETGMLRDSFYVYPYLLLDKKSQQLSPNPDTKHFLTHDVFTHISSIPSEEAKNAPPELKEHIVSKGDTILFSEGYMVMEDFKRYGSSQDTLVAGASLKVVIGNKTEIAEPKILIVTGGEENQFLAVPVKLQNADVEVAIGNILTETNQFVITTKEQSMNTNWVILKSIVFPMINLVWLGMTVMALGFLISLIRRYKESKRTAVNEN